MKPGRIIGLLLLAIACQSNHVDSTVKIEAVTAFVVNPVSTWPKADGFDFPVGPPSAKGYYNAQPFGKNFHLGDDWNGVGGGNTDMGDSVFCIAHGVVLEAENLGGGWGNVLRIGHRMPSGNKFKAVESLYAHLLDFSVQPGDTLRRGDFVGRIGNANGQYLAHLHLEIRDTVGQELGGGYSQHIQGYLDPTMFIKKNRPH
ncbi:MAG: M23 family metallopeptidase [Bacteroidia bacterium]